MIGIAVSQSISDVKRTIEDAQTGTWTEISTNGLENVNSVFVFFTETIDESLLRMEFQSQDMTILQCLGCKTESTTDDKLPFCSFWKFRGKACNYAKKVESENLLAFANIEYGVVIPFDWIRTRPAVNRIGRELQLGACANTDGSAYNSIPCICGGDQFCTVPQLYCDPNGDPKCRYSPSKTTKANGAAAVSPVNATKANGAAAAAEDSTPQVNGSNALAEMSRLVEATRLKLVAATVERRGARSHERVGSVPSSVEPREDEDDGLREEREVRYDVGLHKRMPTDQ